MIFSALVLATTMAAVPVTPPSQAVDHWQQALEQKRPCETEAKENYPWYDKAHLLLSESVCQRALWFDNFFSAGEKLSEKQATSLIWLNFQYRWNERDGEIFKPRLRAIVDLPNTQKRFKLIIEGGDQSTISQNPGEPASSDSEHSSAAIRYKMFDMDNWDFDLDLGAHFSGGPFTRGRARYYHTFNDRTVGSFRQDLVVELKELWYESSKLTLEHFSQDAVYRFVSKGKYGQKTDGLEWQLLLSRTDQISKRAAVTTFIAVEGATEDPDAARQSEISRLGMHYRRSMWRPWFFFELEPQFTLPRKHNYQDTWQITASFEIQMGKSRKRGYY